MPSVLVIVFLISGCAPGIKILGNMPKDIAAKPPASLLNQCTAVLTEYKVIQNNRVMVDDQAVIEHFMKQLYQKEIFRQIITGPKNIDHSSCPLEIKILMTEKLGHNMFIDSVKAFFVGFSFYMLSPVLPMKYSFVSDMKMDVIGTDGKTWIFQTSSSGIAGIPLLYPLEGTALNSLVTQVRERNYALIISKMYQDEKFLRDTPKYPK